MYALCAVIGVAAGFIAGFRLGRAERKVRELVIRTNAQIAQSFGVEATKGDDDGSEAR